MKLLETDDPTLVPGSAHTASVSVPVSPAGLQCTAELFLSSDGGQTKAATSGPIAFTSTGDPQLLALAMTMPMVQGDYAVYLLIISVGVNIGAYQGKEDVVIATPVADIEVDSVAVTPDQVNMGEIVVAKMRCTNYGGTAGSKDVVLSVLDQYGSGLINIIATVSLNAAESKDIQILTDVQLGSAVGHWIISADGKSATLDVMGGNAGITGIVKSADTGLPLQGASVYDIGNPASAVYTDADGRFTYTGIDYSGVRLEVSYPEYTVQLVDVTGLISGTLKDIGVVTLTLVSAIVLVQLKMPAAGKVYQVYDGTSGTIYYDVGFLVQNISSQNAIAALTVEITQSQTGGGGETQLTLTPGQLSYWYGLPYPIGYKFDQSGPAHITAKVNGVVVGEVDVTVAPIPHANLSLVWTLKPPATAAVGSTVSGKVRVTNPTNYPVTISLLKATRISYVTSPPTIVLGTWAETLPANTSKEYPASYVPTAPDGSSEMSFRLQWWSAGTLGDISVYALTSIS